MLRLKTAAILIMAALLCGCASPSTYVVRHYLLNYEPAPAGDAPPVAAAIRVEPFLTFQPYANTAMLYRSGPYELASYPRERWSAVPGPMVSDFLLRDLRRSHRFTAVLSESDPDEAPYILSGTVVDFVETAGPAALLSVDVTLTARAERELTRRIVFQKTCRAEEPMRDRSAQSLAESMSAAMKRLSAALGSDLQRAVAARSAPGAAPKKED